MIHRQNEISKILRDPSAAYEEMMENNPEFRKFVEENKHKSIEQIAMDYNVDPSCIRNYLR